MESLDFKSGILKKNKLEQYEDNLAVHDFFDKEEILKAEYNQYTLTVQYIGEGNIFRIFILNDNNYFRPLVKQEVGDYESLIFFLKEYIKLLTRSEKN
ncbi:hypothetical protein [Priestia aryabhattai]